MVREALLTVQWMHNKGIYHYDMHSGNWLVKRDMRRNVHMYLNDFGSALQPSDEETFVRRFKGSEPSRKRWTEISRTKDLYYMFRYIVIPVLLVYFHGLYRRTRKLYDMTTAEYKLYDAVNQWVSQYYIEEDPDVKEDDDLLDARRMNAFQNVTMDELVKSYRKLEEKLMDIIV